MILSPIGMTREFQRADTHVYRLIAGEHLLVALHSNSPEPLFALTPTGAVLWERLASWTTVDDLARALTERFEVDAQTAASDAAEFLEQLQEVGALTTRGES